MKKIAIIYGEIGNGVQKKALAVLSELLLDYTVAYPYCFPYGAEEDLSEYRCIYIGTKGNNPYLAAHSKAVLSHREEYAICVENDTVMILGAGTVDRIAKMLFE